MFCPLQRRIDTVLVSTFEIHFLPLPAEEDRSHEDSGEEGAVEGEEGGKAAEEGGRGGGRGRGERPAGGGGSPGERLPAPRRAGAGEDEREAAEEDVLQEEQTGECGDQYIVCVHMFLFLFHFISF